jgi:small subunit ribosomal protein S16
MAVKIRFARIGKKHAPIYRIVAIDSRRKREGMFLENLGTYNPKTKQIVQMHDDRIEHWISVGAIPTDAVARLITVRRKQQPKDAVSSEAKAEKKAPAKKTAVKKTESKKSKE